MTETHLSIGEVLSLLQAEFPDVTISKIRFLESQGLIDPERTPSGYRKFYDGDIDRLRWILNQQREHFLPLKVIKDRLAGTDGVPEDVTDPDAPGAVLVPDGPTNGSGAAGGTTAAPSPGGAQPIWMADLARAQAAAPLTAGHGGGGSRPAPDLDRGPTDVSLTAAELAAAAGIGDETLRDLEQYGLLTGRSLGDDVYYDGDALLVATKAARFVELGIGARHLRMFKVAAEREAGFLEQVAMPLLKQRNPQARRQAVELVEELSSLGHDLRATLLRAKLRHHLDQA